MSLSAGDGPRADPIHGGVPGEEAVRRTYVRGLMMAALFLFLFAQPFKASETGDAASGDWPQWGGPHRNFKSDAKGLAKSWPAEGPRRLWTRDLGEGYSSIAADANVLYTMYRRNDEEVAIALDAVTGKTIWEYNYPAPIGPKMTLELGPGPHATPLIAGPNVFTIGTTGKLFALDRKTGQKRWGHDLWNDLGGQVKVRGYSCSPLLYKNMLIMTVGGKGQTVMAFNPENGEVIWKSLDFGVAYSSPIVIDFFGQDQLVVFVGAEAVGLDPNNGEFLWMFPHETPGYGANVTTPVWGEDNVLFLSSSVGSRAVKLTRDSSKTIATELWFTNRMRVFLGNVIRIGRYLYGSSGDIPGVFCAVDMQTGDILWQERIPKASLVYADDRLIMLDEGGTLALATVSSSGLKIESKAEVAQTNAWTPPTLVGTRLYLRDRKSIMALRLD